MTNTPNIDIEKLARRIVELGGSAGVTQRCVPLASGGLNPDSRVNYEFGLVLGVEEFRQEQFYHLNKDYLHNRALHGYGVVSGLEIGTERTSDNDVRINVQTGVGVDQCGRTFLVRSDQCAYLRPWLERNRQRLNLSDGDLTLYVVGTYDECKDALVAIAGQPCASSEQSLAASRIRDSFNITLSDQPPAMPSWETIGRFASLMTRVRIIDGLPQSESDEQEIIRRVRVIDEPEALAALELQLGGYYGEERPDYWQLPAEGINETLDRIFMVWVTEVRPRAMPAVITGCDTADPVETGILLGRIELAIDNARAPIQFAFSDDSPRVSHDERPYLLQTQLIQELLWLGNGGGERRQARIFGSVFVQGDRQLLVWAHHPETLVPANPDADPTDALEVVINDRPVQARVIAATANIRARNVFTVLLNENIPAAARVAVRFRLAAWRVTEDDQPGGRPGEGRPPIDLGLLEPLRRRGRNIREELRELRRRTGGTTPLLASIDQFESEYVGRAGDTITVYAFAERLPEVRDLVVATRRLVGDVPQIRLWFPFDTPLNLGAVSEGRRALGVMDRASGQPLPMRIARTNQQHVWLLVPDVDEGQNRAEVLRRLTEALNNALLILEFDAEVINVQVAGRVEGAQRMLLAAMREGQYSYTGFNGSNMIIVPFVPEQPQAPSQGGLTEEDVIRIIRQNRQPIQPLVPLANLQFMSTNFQNAATFELWFHFDLDWQRFTMRVEEDFTMLVFAEVMEDGQPSLVPLDFQRSRVDDRPNVFRIDVISGRVDNLQYLRFVFPIGERFQIEGEQGAAGSLEEYMKQTGVRLENFYDVENFTSSPAVVLYGRGVTNREG